MANLAKEIDLVSLKRLQKSGANPNVPDHRKWTALHQAVSRGNKRICEALLKAGADPSKKNENGETPAMIAQAMRKPQYHLA